MNSTTIESLAHCLHVVPGWRTLALCVWTDLPWKQHKWKFWEAFICLLVCKAKACLQIGASLVHRMEWAWACLGQTERVQKHLCWNTDGISSTACTPVVHTVSLILTDADKWSDSVPAASHDSREVCNLTVQSKLDGAASLYTWSVLRAYFQSAGNGNNAANHHFHPVHNDMILI